MLQTIITALLVFISTSIDYAVILTIIFSQARSRKSIGHVVAGMYLGTALLVIVSLVAAFVLHYIPEERVIGLLGLVPLFLGIRAAVGSRKEEMEEPEEGEENEILERLESRRASRLFWTIALITIASGGDNLGVYIPYFATLIGNQVLVMVAVFILATAALCALGYRLAKIPFIANTLERYERIIVPIVYIAMGIYIMAESGTLAWLLGGIV